MIASDINNPNFVGAVNPDSRLAVQFYKKAIKNEFKSEQEQRPIFEDFDFVKIWTPGDVLSIIDTYTREDHKRRFPLHWAAYKNNQDADTREIGTPLTEWTKLSPAQAEELKALKFFTVEAVANASDAQLQSIGMVAGQSPYAFRESAQRFLRVAFTAADQTKSDAEIEALKAEKTESDAKIKELQEQMSALMNMVKQEPQKRGRKPAGEKHD